MAEVAWKPPNVTLGHYHPSGSIYIELVKQKKKRKLKQFNKSPDNNSPGFIFCFKCLFSNNP